MVLGDIAKILVDLGDLRQQVLESPTIKYETIPSLRSGFKRGRSSVRSFVDS
jgi:hypothetical protein